MISIDDQLEVLHVFLKNLFLDLQDDFELQQTSPHAPVMATAAYRVNPYFYSFTVCLPARRYLPRHIASPPAYVVEDCVV